MRPFDGGAVGEAPGIGGVVEGPRLEHGVVEEIAARIVRVGVGVENVGDGEAPDGEDDVFAGLAHEQAWQVQVRTVGADFRFAAGVARDADAVADAVSLVDLRGQR